MEPTTAAMIAKAAIAVGTNKKVWTGIAWKRQAGNLAGKQVQMKY